MSASTTTAEKAALCDSLLPLVEAGAEALRPLASLSKPPDPGPLSRRLARLALIGARDLLAGERPPLDAACALLPARIGRDPGPAELLLTLRAVAAALAAFRARYFGWHDALQAPAWHIGGEDGDERAADLLPRNGLAPRPAAPGSGHTRTKIMQHIYNMAEERISHIDEIRRLTHELTALRTQLGEPPLSPLPAPPHDPTDEWSAILSTVRTQAHP